MRVFIKISFLLFSISCILFACNQQTTEKFQSPPGYNLKQPTAIYLKSELDEISGITYYPKDTSIFSINDEIGMLYKIFVRKKVSVLRWKFSTDGDYEDVALVDSTFYVLKSDGNIFSFKVLTKDSITVDDCNSPFAGKNEFETLYYDEFYQKLVLICKDCKEDNKKVVTAWAFDPKQRTFSDTPFFKLDAREIIEQLGQTDVKFKASGAAIHPVTKELYIVSAVNKALVITDRKGKLKQAIALDPKIFKQPEGITFTPNGDLIISNEAADVGSATILIYKPISKK